MKKLLLTLALLASVFSANAQDAKAVAAAKSALEKAQADIQNPKKAANPATWMKLGQAYVAAHDAPFGNVLVGMDATQRKLVLNNLQPLSTESVNLGGAEYTKESYQFVDMYINANGQVDIIVASKPVLENALDKALEAYAKALSLDEKGKNTAKIGEAVNAIAEKYLVEASNSYYLNDFAAASAKFLKVVDAKAGAPLNQLDTMSIFNAGLSATFANDNATARKCFEQCKSNKYYGTNGAVFIRLADLAQKEGRDDDVFAILREGYSILPQNTDILLLLIQQYLSTGKDPQEVFSLIDEAVAKNPASAYPFYAKGQAYEKIGDMEKAIEAYKKCQATDANYEWGYLGEGLLLNKLADGYADKAQNEMDNNKYNALVDEWEKALKQAVPALEKAFEVTGDAEIKNGVAALIKDVAFRLRNTDEKYLEISKKYGELVK